jgi:hypothetical protein
VVALATIHEVYVGNSGNTMNGKIRIEGYVGHTISCINQGLQKMQVPCLNHAFPKIEDWESESIHFWGFIFSPFKAEVSCILVSNHHQNRP